MLHVTGSVDLGSCTITSDDYIPLAPSCSCEAIPLYWRTGDFDTSLLEIGLDTETGALCKVTVVIAAGRIAEERQQGAALTARITHVIGLPMFDRAPWLKRTNLPDMETWEYRDGPWMFERLQGAERVVDEPGTFTMTVEPARVAVWLGEPVAIAMRYDAPSLHRGIDRQGSLRLLQFDGVTVQERSALGVNSGHGSRLP